MHEETHLVGTVPVRAGTAPSRQMNTGAVRAGQGNIKNEELSQQLQP